MKLEPKNIPLFSEKKFFCMFNPGILIHTPPQKSSPMFLVPSTAQLLWKLLNGKQWENKCNAELDCYFTWKKWQDSPCSCGHSANGHEFTRRDWKAKHWKSKIDLAHISDEQMTACVTLSLFIDFPRVRKFSSGISVPNQSFHRWFNTAQSYKGITILTAKLSEDIGHCYYCLLIETFMV